MIFRFIAALYIISIWPQITWKHAIWAALIAVATFPLKKLWDWWTERFWQAFKLSFMTAFKNTEGGKQFMKAFYENRAKKDEQAVKEHPELREMLRCKSCNGGIKQNGHPAELCDDCGGTGWV